MKGHEDEGKESGGTHWFFLSNVMNLVEVGCRGLTSNGTFQFIIDCLTKIGKRPIVVKDFPGFFMNRFISTYLKEAIRLVQLGIATILDKVAGMNSSVK